MPYQCDITDEDSKIVHDIALFERNKSELNRLLGDRFPDQKKLPDYEQTKRFADTCQENPIIGYRSEITAADIIIALHNELEQETGQHNHSLTILNAINESYKEIDLDNQIKKGAVRSAKHAKNKTIDIAGRIGIFTGLASFAVSTVFLCVTLPTSAVFSQGEACAIAVLSGAFIGAIAGITSGGISLPFTTMAANRKYKKTYAELMKKPSPKTLQNIDQTKNRTNDLFNELAMTHLESNTDQRSPQKIRFRAIKPL